MFVRRFVPSFVLAAGAVAQSLLPIPASHTATEGTGFTNVPFGRSTPVRVQYAYDAMLFTGPHTITALQFRLDGGTAAAAKTVDVEIRMSTLAVSLVQIAPTFATNRGADEVVVLPRQFLTLPSQSAANTPSAFLPAIPLTTPFFHDPANGGLLVEIVVFGQPPGAYTLDVTYVCDSPESLVGPASCQQSNGLPLRVESGTTQVIWGRPWVAQILDAPAGAPVILIAGSQETGPWNGLVLPQSLASVGAPGCFLSIDIGGSWIAAAAADGSAQFPFVLANSPSTIGDWLRYQAVVYDPLANPLAFVTSQAKKVQVCGWEPVARVWASGTTATIGTREIGVSAVVQLTVQ